MCKEDEDLPPPTRVAPLQTRLTELALETGPRSQREGRSGPKEQPARRWGAVEVSPVRLIKLGSASSGETDSHRQSQLCLQRQRGRGQGPNS